MTKTTQPSKKRKNWLLTLFGIIGLIIFLLPSIYTWYTSQQQQKEVAEFRNNKTESAKINAAAKAYNDFIAQWQGHVPSKQYYQKAEDLGIKSGAVVSYLSIPSIKLKNMPIGFGDTDENLSQRLGTLPFTDLPAGGANTLATITGHSGFSNQIFFDNIKFLKKGDIIKIYTSESQLSYAVTSKKIIDPNTAGADRNFFIQPNKDMIALMTCTPVFINSHRLIVYAKRVPNKVANQKAVPYRAFWSVEHIYFIIVGLLLLLIALAIWRVSRRQKHEKDK